MKQRRKDPEREDRIHNQAIVDAYGPEEQAMSWYYYLENKIHFPFRAKCIVDPDESSTNEAIGDWHYWVSQGYLF
jgi:hypothetical protein